MATWRFSPVCDHEVGMDPDINYRVFLGWLEGEKINKRKKKKVQISSWFSSALSWDSDSFLGKAIYLPALKGRSPLWFHVETLLSEYSLFIILLAQLSLLAL